MSKELDLLLIKPGDRSIYGGLGSMLPAVEPPLWAALHAAYVRERGFSAAVIDAEADDLSPSEVAKKVKELAPRLVGIEVTGNNLSASTCNMGGAHEYHAAIKKENTDIRTFFWGLHPSALPERTLREEKTDFICLGEGFIPILELLKSGPAGLDDVPGIAFLKAGRFMLNEQPPLIKDLDTLPTAAWDLLPMSKYRAHNWHCFHDIDRRQPYGVIYASLGCPFDCVFCALKTLFRGKPGIRFRSPQNVAADIDLLVRDHGVANIKMLDECFVLNESYVTEVCDLIIGRGYDLNIWAYSRIDTVNEKMLKVLKRAGFNWLAYGIESGAKAVRAGVSKGRFNEEDIKRAIRMTREAGIHVVGNFMFGLPDDTRETMQQTLDLAGELNCEYTNFYVTMAYPGSSLYDDAVRNKVRLPDNWRGYSQYSEETLPLPTKYLSAAEVLEFRDKAFVEFHSSPGYLDMILKTFGSEAVDYIRNMLKVKLKRKLLQKRLVMA